LLIGVDVTCNDGAVCGDVERVILDPVARTVTHLVVRARNHPRKLDRLVPIALAETQAGGTLRLNCSTDDFAKRDAAEEKHTVSESSFGYFHVAGGIAFPASIAATGFVRATARSATSKGSSSTAVTAV
jgi:sporulation protein YlmC with PRC-barrel domain